MHIWLPFEEEVGGYGSAVIFRDSRTQLLQKAAAGAGTCFLCPYDFLYLFKFIKAMKKIHLAGVF